MAFLQSLQGSLLKDMVILDNMFHDGYLSAHELPIYQNLLQGILDTLRGDEDSVEAIVFDEEWPCYILLFISIIFHRSFSIAGHLVNIFQLKSAEIS